jgi:hypothetical protein
VEDTGSKMSMIKIEIKDKYKFRNICGTIVFVCFIGVTFIVGKGSMLLDSYIKDFDYKLHSLVLDVWYIAFLAVFVYILNELNSISNHLGYFVEQHQKKNKVKK